MASMSRDEKRVLIKGPRDTTMPTEVIGSEISDAVGHQSGGFSDDVPGSHKRELGRGQHDVLQHWRQLWGERRETILPTEDAEVTRT